ncbi:GNAT family N-acetyltransferase [Chitinophaga sp.]|uniref:GNAT family N-acetyltransferase n=1 Tax=Chitinophaga sp. TaxID=1869181 RepID=UPI00261302B3|nr:GNAT family N-acetyltransferase [uncultured Chitinophaga sp.]
MIRITQAAPQQLSIVQQIAYDTWPHTFGNILTPEQIDYMLKMMYDLDVLKELVEKKGHVFLLAEADGNFGGFAGYELNYKKEPVSKLHKIYVLPQMQGKNAGLALISEVERIAREAGMKKLSLNVNRDNKAVGFYERNGFAISGEEDIDIGNGFFMNDYIMTKKL